MADYIVTLIQTEKRRIDTVAAASPEAAARAIYDRRHDPAGSSYSVQGPHPDRLATFQVLPSRVREMQL